MKATEGWKGRRAEGLDWRGRRSTSRDEFLQMNPALKILEPRRLSIGVQRDDLAIEHDRFRRERPQSASARAISGNWAVFRFPVATTTAQARRRRLRR
jgi:hypothetical protein